MAEPDAVDEQRRAVEALRTALGAELIETHLSWVLLAAGQAWKIKKALDLGFADFRSLAQRRFYCEEELRLNRRTAPQLYLGVLPLTGSPQRPVLGGAGDVFDWVLHMRAFAQDGLWDRLAARGALGAAQVDALVEPLCALHESAAVADASGPYGTPAQVRAPMSDNLQVLGTLCTEPGEQAVLSRLRDWERQAFGELEPVFARRLADGHVRECHGDLHLGNVAQIDGQPVLFDGLEFSAALRWTDVCSDLAFMAMDLQAHGLDALAHRLVNAWVERSGDVEALRVLRYYRVHRALVRAKVAALRAQQLAGAGADAHRGAHHYLELALRCSRPATPVLMLMRGFSGSGKTAASQGLLEACGAIRFRADVQRKRLFGLGATERGDAAQQALLYSSAASRATYARLLEQADVALSGGYPVILDATFLARQPRLQARALASRLGVRLLILQLEASTETLRARVRRRTAQDGDASDADLTVLESQLAHAQPLGDDELEGQIVIDAEAELAQPASPSHWGSRLEAMGLQPAVAT